MSSSADIEIVYGVPSFYMGHFPVLYACECGLFTQRGLRLRVEFFYGGPELCQAVNDGRIKVGALGLPPFSTAYAAGMPARIIGSCIQQQLDHYLVAHPRVDSMAGLKGKKVGILSFGSCDTFFLRRMLQAEGLDPDHDVEIKAMGQALGGDLSCFETGDIDAGFVVEPKIALGEKQGLFRVLARVGDYFPPYQWGVIFATNDYLAAHHNRLQQFMEIFREACRAIQANPEGAAGVGAEIFNVDADLCLQALKRDLVNWQVDARIDFKGMQNALKIQKELGALNTDLDVSRMVQQL